MNPAHKKSCPSLHIKKFRSATGDEFSFIHFGLKVIKTHTLRLIDTVGVNKAEKTINP